MIKIIERGKRPNPVKQFICGKCGCVFESDEYRKESDKNDEYYVCKCPEPWCTGNGYHVPQSAR